MAGRIEGQQGLLYLEKVFGVTVRSSYSLEMCQGIKWGGGGPKAKQRLGGSNESCAVLTTNNLTICIEKFETEWPSMGGNKGLWLRRQNLELDFLDSNPSSTPTSPLIGFVTLGDLFNLLVPQFPHL